MDDAAGDLNGAGSAVVAATDARPSRSARGRHGSALDPDLAAGTGGCATDTCARYAAPRHDASAVAPEPAGLPAVQTGADSGGVYASDRGHVAAGQVELRAGACVVRRRAVSGRTVRIGAAADAGRIYAARGRHRHVGAVDLDRSAAAELAAADAGRVVAARGDDRGVDAVDVNVDAAGRAAPAGWIESRAADAGAAGAARGGHVAPADLDIGGNAPLSGADRGTAALARGDDRAAVDYDPARVGRKTRAVSGAADAGGRAAAVGGEASVAIRFEAERAVCADVDRREVSDGRERVRADEHHRRSPARQDRDRRPLAARLLAGPVGEIDDEIRDDGLAAL